MLKDQIIDVFNRGRLSFFRKIFTRAREKESCLTSMEVFSLKVISLLDRPTIGQYARFIGISQSNATYKINSLMHKGYLTRLHSDEDGREFNLELSDKFYEYDRDFQSQIEHITQKVVSGLNADEKKAVSKALKILSEEFDIILDK